ncbi:glycosyltransferase [Alienimonas californiensis]|uniref:Teichuronic acid biosynthesis glycosyltransferase TuaH n=1 Tax=Alienimonas californiensis TaxID=2527989 RepID=A0A517P444_9PLAN|nr:glycosyltransferase [Alienimonas californiensis]QDT14162.1 Putative teichuronic acid biosynthesis glycosyltransferase TuaH [Alienimonas californiensis]
MTEVPEVDPPPAARSQFHTLVVFSDDWGRHPSSCQHIVRHLLDDHRVLWVNTIGLRPPRLDLATVTRAAGKFRHWTGGGGAASAPADAGPEPTVLNPKMWPWFRRPHDRRLNRQLLARQLVGPIEEARRDGPVAAITTVPVMAPLVGALPVDRWIYYCVDDFSVWPGVDGATAGELEREVVAKADRLVAAGPGLRDRLMTMERRAEVHVVEHGVDLEFWSNPKVPFPHRLPEGPLVVFWGLIDRRLDVEAVHAIADAVGPNSPRPATVLLVGPGQDEPPELTNRPNVLRIPAVPHATLPALAAAAAVLVMPYRDAPVTRAMQPLKLLEYLACGKPVVVRDLPATLPYAGACDLAADPPAFVNGVVHRLNPSLSHVERTIWSTFLIDVSWEKRTEKFVTFALA